MKVDFSKKGELTIIVLSLISDLLALVLFFEDLDNESSEDKTATKEKEELQKTIENLTARLQNIEELVNKLTPK
jgi:uncharacterized protein YlxW (UPF0749 family)